MDWGEQEVTLLQFLLFKQGLVAACAGGARAGGAVPSVG